MKELSLLVPIWLDTVHIVTLFSCFSQVSAPGENTDTLGRRLLAALLATRPDDMKTGDAEQSFDSG